MKLSLRGFAARARSLWRSAAVRGLALVSAVGYAAVNALTWYLLLSASGIACIVAGTNILLGAGPALIVAGVLLLLSAATIGRGMRRA